MQITIKFEFWSAKKKLWYHFASYQGWGVAICHNTSSLNGKIPKSYLEASNRFYPSIYLLISLQNPVKNSLQNSKHSGNFTIFMKICGPVVDYLNKHTIESINSMDSIQARKNLKKLATKKSLGWSCPIHNSTPKRPGRISYSKCSV